MTCPDRPTDLDAFLAGEPVSDATRAHTETCDVCAYEADLDAHISAALAARRCTQAPPALVAAALAEARRQPASAGALAAARPAVRNARPRRLRTAALAVIAGLAVLASVWMMNTAPLPETSPESEPLHAETTSPAPQPPRTAPEPDGLAEAAEQSDTPPAPRAAPAPPRRRSPARRAPAPPAREPLVAQNDRQPDPTDTPPSPDEIAQAEAELLLAFALIGEAQTQADRAVRNRTDVVPAAFDQALSLTP